MLCLIKLGPRLGDAAEKRRPPNTAEENASSNARCDTILENVLRDADGDALSMVSEMGARSLKAMPPWSCAFRSFFVKAAMRNEQS
jgi:hypothetical protein